MRIVGSDSSLISLGRSLCLRKGCLCQLDICIRVGISFLRNYRQDWRLDDLCKFSRNDLAKQFFLALSLLLEESASKIHRSRPDELFATF
jgi:hypothetical protein